MMKLQDFTPYSRFLSTHHLVDIAITEQRMNLPCWARLRSSNPIFRGIEVEDGSIGVPRYMNKQLRSLDDGD